MFAEFLGFFPFVGLFSVVSKRLLSGTDLAFAAALLWGILYVYTGSRLRSFPCPRCGKNFFGGILGDSSLVFSRPGAFFGRQCAYCGLEKYGGVSASDDSSSSSTFEGAFIRKRNFWLLFAAVQTAGAIFLHFENLRLNIAAILLGALLLIPGSVVELVSTPNVNPSLKIALVILVNAAGWYGLRRIFLLGPKAR